MSGSDRRYLFRGTGWIAVGVGLGGVETVLGFVGEGEFGLFFSRRLLRLLGRACLVIGVAKGWVILFEQLSFCENEIERLIYDGVLI